jgi:hypothetical protein
LHARLLVPLGRASCHPHFNAGSNAPDCVVASKYFEGPDGLIRNALPKTASPNTLMCRLCSVIRRLDVVDRSVCLRRHELFSDFGSARSASVFLMSAVSTSRATIASLYDTGCGGLNADTRSRGFASAHGASLVSDADRLLFRQFTLVWLH